MKGLAIFCRWCQWWRRGVDACDVCGNPWFEYGGRLSYTLDEIVDPRGIYGPNRGNEAL